MQESELTEIIPLTCTIPFWGQHPIFTPWVSQGSPREWWVCFPSSLRAHQLTMEGWNCCWLIKNLPANTGDVRDRGSIPGLGRSPRKGQRTHSNILGWRIPWTEEPGLLQSIGSQRAGLDWSHLALTWHPYLLIWQEILHFSGVQVSLGDSDAIIRGFSLGPLRRIWAVSSVKY